MKTKTVHAATAAAAITMGLLASPSALAATDMFMKIGDIKGESQDAAHKEWIDVLAWSWGMSHSVKPRKSRRDRVLVCVQDIAVVKYIDSATPDILMTVALGDRFPDAELVVRKTGTSGPASDYLTIRMQGVSVTSLSTGGSGGEDRLTENITLNFEKATVEYTPQDEKGGSGGTIFADVDGSGSKCN